MIANAKFQPMIPRIGPETDVSVNVRTKLAEADPDQPALRQARHRPG